MSEKTFKDKLSDALELFDQKIPSLAAKLVTEHPVDPHHEKSPAFNLYCALEFALLNNQNKAQLEERLQQVLNTVKEHPNHLLITERLIKTINNDMELGLNIENISPATPKAELEVLKKIEIYALKLSINRNAAVQAEIEGKAHHYTHITQEEIKSIAEPIAEKVMNQCKAIGRDSTFVMSEEEKDLLSSHILGFLHPTPHCYAPSGENYPEINNADSILSAYKNMLGSGGSSGYQGAVRFFFSKFIDEFIAREEKLQKGASRC